MIDCDIPREWPSFPRSSSFDGDRRLRTQAFKQLISVGSCLQRLVKGRRLKTPADINVGLASVTPCIEQPELWIKASEILVVRLITVYWRVQPVAIIALDVDRLETSEDREALRQVVLILEIKGEICCEGCIGCDQGSDVAIEVRIVRVCFSFERQIESDGQSVSPPEDVRGGLKGQVSAEVIRVEVNGAQRIVRIEFSTLKLIAMTVIGA